MIVRKLSEYGREEALLGLSLSFYDHQDNIQDWWYESGKEVKAAKQAGVLAFKGLGHNKYLASIGVWLYIQAARCWWSEFDTYKVGVTANSSSTMHTLSRRQTNENDFEQGTSLSSIEAFNSCLQDYKDPESTFYHDITRLKLNLPEGWLQERQVFCNYMSLQNIIKQRTGHRLDYWDIFCDRVLEQVDYPELLKEQE
jgi:hypothetical protein